MFTVLSLFFMLLVFPLVVLANHAALRVDPFNTLPDSSAATFRTNSRIFWEHEEAQRAGRAHAAFIYSGGLHGTSSTLTAPSIDTEAFTPERVNQSGTAILYAAAATDTCWTIISSDNNGITGWTQVGTTAYYYQCEGDATPNQPTLPANSAWLLSIDVTGSAITTVYDMRITKPCPVPSFGSIDVTCVAGRTFRDRILNAEALLPSTGGVIDARGLMGVYSTRGWTHTRANVALLLGAVTLRLTCSSGQNGAIQINVDNVAIIGSGPGVTKIEGYCDSIVGYTGSPVKVGDDLIRPSGPPGASGIRTSGVLIRDLELDGRGASLTSCTTNDVIQSGINDGSGTRLTVENTWVHDQPCHGIVVNGNNYSTPNSANNIVKGNRVYSNGNAASGGNGIIVAGATNYTKVHDNIVYSNRLSGIFFNGSDSLLNQYNEITNNTVRDNNTLTTGYGGITALDTRDLLVSNNTVYGHPVACITVGIQSGTSLRHKISQNRCVGGLASSTVGIVFDNSTDGDISSNYINNVANRGISGSASVRTKYSDNYIVGITQGTSGSSGCIYIGGSDSVAGGNNCYSVTGAGNGIIIVTGLTGVTINPNHYTSIGGLVVNDLGTPASRRFDENAFGRYGGVYGTSIVWHLSQSSSLTFAAPSSVPGVTSQSTTMTGALLGDTCIVAAPFDLGGQPLACYVQSGSVVVVVFTQLTGAAIAPNGGAAANYRIDLWRH